jgi:hypothetical protein
VVIRFAGSGARLDEWTVPRGAGHIKVCEKQPRNFHIATPYFTQTDMQLTGSLHLRSRRDRRDSHASRTRAAVLQTLARAKRSGGPEDLALYSCSCGYAFKAQVSTSVGCPHCGTSQAW